MTEDTHNSKSLWGSASGKREVVVLIEYVNIDNFRVKISEDNTEPGAEF